MNDVFSLPPDLTDAERADVDKFLREAHAEVSERVALWVRVRRSFRYHRDNGAPKRQALEAVVDVDRLPVSVRTARRIVDNDGAWSVPD